MKVKARSEVVTIAELEEAAETYSPRYVLWTEREDAIVSRYFGRVDMDILMKHLPGRTRAAVQRRGLMLRNGK